MLIDAVCNFSCSSVRCWGLYGTLYFILTRYVFCVLFCLSVVCLDYTDCFCVGVKGSFMCSNDHMHLKERYGASYFCDPYVMFIVKHKADWHWRLLQMSAYGRARYAERAWLFPFSHSHGKETVACGMSCVMLIMRRTGLWVHVDL